VTSPHEPHKTHEPHEHHEHHEHHEDVPVAARVRRLEERLIAAGLITDDEIDELLTRFYADAFPVNGARIVARAWTDEQFRDRLLADGSAAATELGFGAQTSGFELRVVANTPDRHNVIVCTLCSCYPLSLLGPSPGWYRSLAYRSRTVREPRAVLAEFGLTLPAATGVDVWDSTAEIRYLVVPVRPAGTDGLGQEELAAVVTRNGMIGTAAV
jgi:nitrile hydratase subunit alpha